MSCKRCGEQDDFCDGNSSEELCKHCLDHCCEQCFTELETEIEEEHQTCEDCYEPPYYKRQPQYFTFSLEDIEEYEFEQELIQNQIKLNGEIAEQKKAQLQARLEANDYNLQTEMNLGEIIENYF